MGSSGSRFSDPMVMGVVLIQPFSHDSHAAHITVEVGKSSDLASSGGGDGSSQAYTYSAAICSYHIKDNTCMPHDSCEYSCVVN